MTAASTLDSPPPQRAWRSIGTKIVLIVILVNAVLSLAATSTQIYLSYQRDKEDVLGEIAIIERGFKTSLETALWEFNFPLIEALLDGIASNGDVAYLELTGTDGSHWLRRNDAIRVDTSQAITLERATENGPRVVLGEMRIGLSLEHAMSQVWADFLTVLASNLAKTTLASAILLGLFNKTVTKHLRRVAGHVSETSWLNTDAPLSLERGRNGRCDEIDLIVSAINTAKARSAQDYAALAAQIKKRTAAQVALQNKAEALQAANRTQAEFTYSISHDLKSPSNTLRMLLDEIEAEGGPSLSQTAREMIESAQVTNMRMAQLIDDIIMYSHAVEGPFDPEVINVNALVDDVSEGLRTKIADAGATIEAAATDTVFGSRVQIKLLMQNLIDNALKYADPNRPAHIRIGTKADLTGAVTVSVQDNGIGIDPAHHARIFGLFKRLHTHDVVAGSGLGLAICERIAANHEGKITVQSDQGGGTTMRITLPGNRSGGIGDDDLDPAVSVTPLFG